MYKGNFIFLLQKSNFGTGTKVYAYVTEEAHRIYIIDRQAPPHVFTDWNNGIEVNLKLSEYATLDEIGSAIDELE